MLLLISLRLVPDFKVLGFSVDEVYLLAERKQMEAAKSMGDELGLSHTLWDTMKGIAFFKKELVINKRYGPLGSIFPF